MGTKLLTQNSEVSYRTISNATELNDGFNILEKWNFLTGGIQTTELLGQNVSILISEGPFTVESNEKVTVAFALIAAESQAALDSSAQKAQLFWDDLATGIISNEKLTPIYTFQLSQNYPNPFNPATTIEFTVPQNDQVEMIVYNLLGQAVRNLVNRSLSAGNYKILWDGNNDVGIPVSSGIYIYKLKVGDYVGIRKMILLR
jgi:flagellar hook assembly protein FlgD